MASQILLVDDELPVLNALKRVLRREGHEILVAQTGQEALATLHQAELAVIVCDYGLGSMTGAEVLAKAANIRPNTVRITVAQVEYGS
ncbi:MAG: response regulator [Phycisphaerae bacterium]